MNSPRYSIQRNGETAKIWKGKRPLIQWMDIELTERCNNNCIHCCINLPANDTAAMERELSTEAIKAILQEAASLGCLTVRFTGGEPLLRKDFEELYLFARRQGLKVRLFTNATLLAPFEELFVRIPPRERIEVTVYGMEKGSYEAVTRTPGSFAEAWKGIHLLLERNIPFLAKGALLPPNREERDDFEAWTATVPGMNKIISYAMFFTLRTRRDHEKNQLIQKLRLTPQEGLRALTRKKDGYPKQMGQFCSKFLSPPGDLLFTCGAGVGGGCVDAYGYLYPCVLLRHPAAAYDLKRGSLKDAVENHFPEVRKRKAEDAAYMNRCARCFLRGLCEQCPAKSWAEHGTLDTPVEYYCALAHEQARYLGLIRENEHAWDIGNGMDRLPILNEIRTPREGRLRSKIPVEKPLGP